MKAAPGSVSAPALLRFVALTIRTQAQILVWLHRTAIVSRVMPDGGPRAKRLHVGRRTFCPVDHCKPVVVRAALAGRVPALQREQDVGCAREFRIACGLVPVRP